MSNEIECALRGVRTTIPVTVPTLLSVAVLSGRLVGGVVRGVLAALGLGALVQRGRALAVLVLCSAVAVLSPVLYGASAVYALAQLTLTGMLGGPFAGTLWSLRRTTATIRPRRLATTSRFGSALAGDERCRRAESADASLRELGFMPRGTQPSPDSIRANGRFIASRAERTAATARSPRDSAEPT